MVFGGLGVMLYGGQSSLSSVERALHKVDIQSVFFATMFVIILLVLAYLTNPSETSFRTYLTEQSFRQHLSRLEDSNHEDPSDSDDSGVHFSLVRRRPKPTSGGLPSFASAQPFHFANRAAVSLRTPKHVFYSFGIMTIAAVLPSTTRSGAKPQTEGGFMVSESWFIGAFGRWWRGGPIQAWWVESVVNAKDTERCNSGVLDMKPLDALESYDGHPSINARESPSKSRTSERSLQRVPSGAPRSTTPPPLPKSASLPLHVTRVPLDKAPSQRAAPAPAQTLPTPAPEPARLNPPQLLPSPSAIFDQSPVISEILRQISSSKASVHELRAQLKDSRAAAAEAHTAIQNDLEEHRERKRNEDAARSELKTRTKTLEDSKRVAETNKREAEKRLRAAETARDSASELIGRLDREIGALRERMGEDEAAVVRSKEDGDEMEKELAEQLERKRKEIRVAEEVVAALNSRTKELEGKIAAEEERLKRAKEQAELKKQDRAFYPLHVVSEPVEPSLWSPIVPGAPASASSDPHTEARTDAAQVEVFTDMSSTAVHDELLTGTEALTTSPRPRQLSLGSISNFRQQSRPSIEEPALPIVQVESHLSVSTAVSAPAVSVTKFSPFGDQELEVPTELHTGQSISPRSTSLIPTSLIKTLEGNSIGEDLSRSFQSENDTVLDRDWRKLNLFPPPPVENPTVYNASPTSITCPPFDAVEQEDPFEIRPPPPPLRHRFTSDGLETERLYSAATNGLIAPSDMQPLARARTHESDSSDKAMQQHQQHRRWFSVKEQKDRKGNSVVGLGLNPEAKVFQFKKTFPMFTYGQKPVTFESVISHPPSVIPGLLAPPADSLFSTLSMRAFAPSPEEREALGRAMGSANTSLERLPTLSDVVIGSLPASPNHVNAIAAPPQHTLAEAGARSLGLSWLSSLPRMKKPKFSPWEDESAEDTVVSGAAH